MLSILRLLHNCIILVCYYFCVVSLSCSIIVCMYCSFCYHCCVINVCFIIILCKIHSVLSKSVNTFNCINTFCAYHRYRALGPWDSWTSSLHQHLLILPLTSSYLLLSLPPSFLLWYGLVRGGGMSCDIGK